MVNRSISFLGAFIPTVGVDFAGSCFAPRFSVFAAFAIVFALPYIKLMICSSSALRIFFIAIPSLIFFAIIDLKPSS